MNVRKALEEYLYTMPDLLPTKWENVPYDPSSGVEYQEVNLLRATPDDITLGYEDSSEFRGIFQITLKYPKGKGSKTAEDKAKTIADYFKRGTVITNDDDGVLNVEIRNTPNITTLGVIDDRFIVVVSIPYYIFN